jgi:hypothetical protein
MELRDTLQSLAELVFDIEKHEALAELDENEQIRQIEAMRADVAKGNRIAEANERFSEESIAPHEQAQHKPVKKEDPSP